MKQVPLFEKLEEKFYFITSRILWHILAGLGGLALCGGILLLLWGIIPASKPTVEQPVYPEPVKVATEEIASLLMPDAGRTRLDLQEAEDATPLSEAQEKKHDPAEAAYLAAIESLKVLMPSEKFTWQSRGQWLQTWWERRWVVTVLGIDDRLKAAYEKANAMDFGSRKELLIAYTSLVRAFPLEHRLKVLSAAIEFTRDNVSASVRNVELLLAAVPHFTMDNADFVETLATFGKKNPRDGREFIEYANAVIPTFAPEIRRPMLNALVSGYYSYFDDIGRQKEATDLFLGISKSFEAESQPKALTEYYRLFVQRNAERQRRIAELDAGYQRAQNEAEAILAQRQAEKASNRWLGLQLAGASVIFIALVAMFLVLLSIQRNVRMMRETSGGGNG